MSLLRTILFVFASAETWEDSPALTAMWESMNGKKAQEIETLLVQMPEIVKARAADGRGPAWWAWEFEYEHGLAALIAAGADVETEDGDAGGQTPKEMCAGDADSILASAKGLVPGIKANFEKIKAEMEKARMDDEDDDDAFVDESFDDEDF
jgi:hypothetical protein